MNYLEIFAAISIIMADFFIISAMSGFCRQENFFVKIHAANMFSIYGASFIFLAIGISSTSPIIFFEICGVVVLNILSALAVGHCLMRNAVLSGVECEAKSREEATRLKENEKNEVYNALREKNKKKEEKIKLKKELEKKKFKDKQEKDRLKEEEKQNKKQSKKEEKKLWAAVPKTGDTQTPISPQDETYKAEPIKVVSKYSKKDAQFREDPSNIEKKNEELKIKIREQKKILRKKLETIRRNAFITRKPDEIDKAEKLINEILTKHNLTEDMLKDDDEE